MKKGASRFITEDDLFSLRPSDESVNLGNALKKAMEKQQVIF
jgi:ATP-binding cassette subfamily C (CFTR/MRP) protein 1